MENEERGSKDKVRDVLREVESIPPSSILHF